MESTTENNQVAIILNSIEVLKTGPQILQSNQIRKDKAIAYGEKLLVEIDAEGMTTERDETAMKYLVKVNTANKEMKEQRAGVTQIMDQLKKMYTEVEAELDITKPNSVPAKVQAHRNTFAKQQAAEKEQKRLEAQRIADRAKEAIEIKAGFEQRFTNHYHNYLASRKQATLNSFNAITYADFGERAAKLKTIAPSLDVVKLIEGLPVKTSAVFHTTIELKALENEVYELKIVDFVNNYAAEMRLLFDDLIEKLPSKLRELTEQKRLADEAAAEQERQRLETEKRNNEIAAANAERRLQLEKEAEEARQEDARRNAELQKQQEEALAQQKAREAAEAEKIEAETAEAKRQSDLQVEVKKQGEQTMVMFENEAAVAEIGTQAQVNKGYEITVLHPVGYTQIFSLWFDQEGKNLPIDKLGNMKLDQMKAWCEKKALKDGTKIESKFLQYEESFKAVNKKAKV